MLLRRIGSWLRNAWLIVGLSIAALCPVCRASCSAASALQIYATNLEIVRMLGRRYDFDFLAYWQPSILDKPHLTRHESSYRAEMQPMEPFFRRTYDLICQGHSDDRHEVRDISLVFRRLGFRSLWTNSTWVIRAIKW